MSNKRRSSIPFEFLRNSTRQIQIPLVARGNTLAQQSKITLKEKLANPSKQRLLKLKDPSYILRPPKLSKTQQFFKRLDKNYNIFYPESIFIFIWNMLITIGILINLVEIPISFFFTKVVYQDQFSNILTIFLNYFFIFALIFDIIIIKLNLAYYKHGELITNRYEIFKQYVKIQFWIDLIGIISLGVYVFSGQYMLIYAKAFFYLKIYTVLKLDTQFVNFLELNKYIYSIYMFLRIVVFLVFIIVWVASIYFAIDYYFYQKQGFYRQNNLLWLTGSGAVNDMNVLTSFSWPYWLVYASYWAMQTATTVGYGNMTPLNPVQTFYCNCIIILMTIMFAFFINSVWGIIGQLDESSVKYYQNWRNLKIFLKKSSFSQKTKQKVSVYFHDVWKNQDNDKQVKQITNTLSQGLKKQILVSSNRYMFEGIEIFNILNKSDPQNFKRLISSLTSHIYQLKLAQEQVLYQQDDCDTNLYCLLRGKIKLVFKSNYYNQIQRSIQIKAKFGNQQFFLQRKKYCKAIAECYSKVSVLQKNIFIQKLKDFPSLYKKFVILSYRVKIYNQLQLINEKCWFCSQNHQTKKCPTKTNWREKHYKKEASLSSLNMLQQMKRSQQRKVTYRRGIKSSKIIGNAYQKYINIDIVDENDEQNLKMSGFIQKHQIANLLFSQ